MNWFLILQRELRIASRRKSTYRDRLTIGSIAFATALVFALFIPSSSTTAGRVLFEILSWGGFLYCLFDGMRQTSDCLSQERREGTLGLLFLTELRGTDVVLGKLSAAAIKTYSSFLVIMPVFAVPICMGGVTWGEFWRVTLAVLVGSFLALSAGMLASAISFGSFAAIGKAFLFVITAVLFLPVTEALLWKENIDLKSGNFDWLTGPLGMFLGAREAPFIKDPSSFWSAVLYTMTACVLLLWIAGLISHRSWRRDENLNNESWWQRLLRPSVGHSEAWGSPSAKTAPAVWLAERTLPGRKLLWLVILFGVIVCFFVGGLCGNEAAIILGIIQIAYGFLLKLWLAAIAPQSLNASRRSGALELLLCTPLSQIKIIQGQLDALVGYFLPSALAISIGLPIAGSIGAAVANANSVVDTTFILLFAMFWIVLFLLDLFAIGYVGLWFGLTEVQSQRAVAKTIFRVLLLPWLTLLIPCLGVLGMFAWPIIWSYWASSRLHRRFREEVQKQFSEDLIK